MPHVSLWVHVVWATHNRQPLLTDAARPTILQHIRTNAAAKGLHLDHLNGYRDHLHALLELGATRALAEAVQLIKGESAHWLNAEKLLGPGRFAWQAEYWAASVSPSRLTTVRGYIRKQEEHHRTRTFAEEYDNLMRSEGFAEGRDPA